MKKVLLCGTALLGLAVTSAPAMADLNLGIEGFYRGYAVYADDDAAAPGTRDFDFRRDTEIHFTGEVTLDNGLTVGVHHELDLGGAVETDESYAYFSGSWGRINAGSEDGAAYLLQVAAPSADSNVDGQRVYIQGLGALGATALDYDHADFAQSDRITYLTPKFNGFQAGVSYAAEAGQKPAGVVGLPSDNDADGYENLWEAAARWDGEFQGFGVSLGAGYSHASLEAVGASFGDDLQTWNVGANIAWNAFTFGGAYLKGETEDATGADLDSKTWVVGAGWDNGPYHLGVSYLDTDNEIGGVDAKRTTVGGGYTFGPGMSFRGAVAFGDIDTGAGDEDFTQITLGTDIAF